MPTEILIVEDSPTQAVRLQHLLETDEYSVRLAHNGAEGLAEARRRAPRLVIADVEMPVMNGYEMCRDFKRDPLLSDVPIILLTSMANPEDVLRGLEANADYYLTKPYESDDLLARVREILCHPPPHHTPESSPPIEVALNGRKHWVTADRSQVLRLLLSTYSDAVHRTAQLTQSQTDLHRQNQLLDSAVRSERQAHEDLKKAQSQLVQSEKMASLGQMVAGVAHEINNPLAFVSNNIAVLQRDVNALHELLDLYRRFADAPDQRPELAREIRDLSDRIDIDYTIKNLSEILDRSGEGLKRIQQIVVDLRDFARLDAGDLSAVDLNAGIQSTVTMIRNKAHDKRLKIELDLHPLPPVLCYPAKINQVVMNLVANAIDASEENGVIDIRTGLKEKGVQIEVADRGTGIDPAIRDKIFDPFFTTKPYGKGTGLGLSISYGIVCDHGGQIEVKSEIGRGTRFLVFLPCHPPTF